MQLIKPKIFLLCFSFPYICIFFSSFFSEISIDHCFKGKTIEVIWKYSFSYKSGISTCIFWSKFYSVFPELVPPPLVEAAVPSPGLTHNHSVRWGSWGPGQASHVPRGTVVAETGGLRTWDSLLRGTHKKGQWGWMYTTVYVKLGYWILKALCCYQINYATPLVSFDAQIHVCHPLVNNSTVTITFISRYLLEYLKQL